ncbi:gypsy type transposase [Tanacetum coccineum]|uniref:Gypsy type transposase n=1 Tax=Tanacetum coccineum TaxID=301880 RepID=A0ABQ5EPD6_9ASTR
MQSWDAALWKEAIDDEISFIMENNTWVLSDLPPGCKPLGCKWIFKRKMKVDGTIDKFKARLVIQGFRQKEGIDYFDTYAPIARITTIRLLLALVVIHNLVIHQMDVKTAFLNGDLEEEVYMKQPKGFVMPGGRVGKVRYWVPAVIYLEWVIIDGQIGKVRYWVTTGKEGRRTTVYFYQAAYPRGRQDPLNPGLAACSWSLLWTVDVFSFAYLPLLSFILLPGFPPFESFIMSLEESDDLAILDAEPVGPTLEVGSLPKFDMHIHKSTLTGTQVKWLTKCYGIPKDLRPRVPPEGMTMNVLPNDAIGLYAHHFQQGGLRGALTSRYGATDSSCRHNEDIPPKTGDMITAEIPCQKVLEDKEKKKRKAQEKAAANAPAADIQAGETVAKDAGRAGPRKKRKVRSGPQVQPVSEHVYSPTPLNHAKPLEILVDEEPLPPPLPAGRMGILRNQTDEHASPPRVIAIGETVIGEGGQGNTGTAVAIEGHGDNEGGLSGLWTQPSPAHHSGVRDESAIKRSWKLLCQSSQHQANVLLRFEALKEQHADLVYTHVSCQDVKARYKECKKELATVRSAYDEIVSAYDQLSKSYDGALTREKSLQDRLEELEEALKQAEVDAHQLRLEKERLFSLAVGKGFIDGISIGRKEPNIQAILKATPNVDPATSETFMGAYEKLFDKRYPYVDKVARMYLLDLSGLQNIMPDETGPTPGGGSRDTPTASYA